MSPASRKPRPPKQRKPRTPRPLSAAKLELKRLSHLARLARSAKLRHDRFIKAKVAALVLSNQKKRARFLAAIKARLLKPKKLNQKKPDRKPIHVKMTAPLRPEKPQRAVLPKRAKLPKRTDPHSKPKVRLTVKKERTPIRSTKLFAIRLRKLKSIKTLNGPAKPFARHRANVVNWNDGNQVSPQWKKFPDGHTGYYTTNAAYRFPDSASIMDDIVGNKGHYNPVSQWKFEGHLSRIPSVDAGGGQRFDNLFDYVFFPARVHNMEFAGWPWLPFVSASTLSDYSISAFNQFHDQIPTTVSLANFMYELKDMKGMIPKIEKSFTKTVANNFLGFSFGTAPFVGDIKSMIQMSDAVDKRLQHLMSVNGKTTDLTFKREASFEEPFSFTRSLSDAWDYSDTQNGDRLEFTRQSARTTVQITGRLTQDLSDLAGANAKLKALIASSGFNHPARIIWNAIPYSFLVDWLFSVGKLLDSLTVQPFGGTYNVSDVGYSIKKEASWIVTYKTAGVDNVLGNPTLGAVRVSSYERFNGFPAYSLFLTDLTLTPKQQVLATAMLEQRRR